MSGTSQASVSEAGEVPLPGIASIQHNYIHKYGQNIDSITKDKFSLFTVYVAGYNEYKAQTDNSFFLKLTMLEYLEAT